MVAWHVYDADELAQCGLAAAASMFDLAPGVELRRGLILVLSKAVRGYTQWRVVAWIPGDSELEPMLIVEPWTGEPV